MNDKILDETVRYTKTKRCCLPSYLRCEDRTCGGCLLFKTKRIYDRLPPGKRRDLPKIVIKYIKKSYQPKESSDMLDKMDDFWREAEKYQKNKE